MDSTTNPSLRSFVRVAVDSHFSIQNLPFGVFQRPSASEPTVGIAIGDQILDLSILEEVGLLKCPALEGRTVFHQGSLNAFMALGPGAWRAVRSITSQLLRADKGNLESRPDVCQRALVPMTEAVMLLPAFIGDYTDFYSSREHATNVGTMFRGPDKALMPNWLHLPVGYHGRSSSIIVSGTDLHRPCGQTMTEGAPGPSFGPSRSLDFELETAFFVGPGNDLGQPITIGQAPNHIFGMVLLNDWSARDIQQWEYVPLGPFLGKNFATSISPWIVTMDALEPFRSTGPKQDPEPLPYLRSASNWSYDIHLEVSLQGEKMACPHRICTTNFKYLYWNMCQQLAHHASNGCNLRPGDLLASGTISGPTPESFGSMLELAWKGSRPLAFPNGESRRFLEDGDRVTMTGWCQGSGYRVGFGEVTGKVLPAVG